MGPITIHLPGAWSPGVKFGSHLIMRFHGPGGNFRKSLTWSGSIRFPWAEAPEAPEGVGFLKGQDGQVPQKV